VVVVVAFCGMVVVVVVVFCGAVVVVVVVVFVEYGTLDIVLVVVGHDDMSGY